MQSGKIKHWSLDKGYGFIDVDDQVEDVFFHISKVKLSSPIRVGQPVYFNSERSDKGQLRATEVTSTTLSPNLDPTSNSSTLNSDSTGNQTSAQNSNSHQNPTILPRNHQKPQNKKNSLSKLLSLIAILAVAVYFISGLAATFSNHDSSTTAILEAQLSQQAQAKSTTGDIQIDETLRLIQRGGPYPYSSKDGSIFGNREGKLPKQSSGYYHEYTVPTPGLSHRGPRRIVTGGNPPTVYYLTVDHYDSFSQLQVN